MLRYMTATAAFAVTTAFANVASAATYLTPGNVYEAAFSFSFADIQAATPFPLLGISNPRLGGLSIAFGLAFDLPAGETAAFGIYDASDNLFVLRSITAGAAAVGNVAFASSSEPVPYSGTVRATTTAFLLEITTAILIVDVDAEVFNPLGGTTLTEQEIRIGLDFQPVEPPAAVPLPAAGILLVGGLGALGAVRLKRQKSRWLPDQ